MKKLEQTFDVKSIEIIDYAWAIARIPKNEYINELVQKQLFISLIEQVCEISFNLGSEEGKIR
jgi:hypothetical protein